MVEYGDIRYEQADGIATITLNRPEVMNAISPRLEEELHTALDEAEGDPAVRVVILTGEGRSFSTGYDMVANRKPPPGTNAEKLRNWWERDARTPRHLMHIMELWKPVIAAVNGYCMGGGFWYAMACDMTYASDRAVFAQPEVRHASNTTALFPALAGWKHANRYALTGDHLDAQEALRIGILNDVVPHDDLMDTVRDIARRIALVPADTVRVNKAIATYTAEALGIKNALNVGAFLSVIAHSSDDAEDIAHLLSAKRGGDMKQFLKLRDDPFRPEPFGPRSHRGA